MIDLSRTIAITPEEFNEELRRAWEDGALEMSIWTTNYISGMDDPKPLNPHGDREWRR